MKRGAELLSGIFIDIDRKIFLSYYLPIMLMIRLQKVGKIHTATFRVVVTEKTTGPRRQYLELVGTLDRKTKKLSLNKDRILYWISKGAKISDTVHNLLISEKIMTGAKKPVHKTSKQETSDKQQERAAVTETMPATS